MNFVPHPIIGNLSLAALFLGVGIVLAKTKKGAIWGLVAACLIGATHYLINIRPDLFVAVFPFKNIIYYSNLFPFAVMLAVPCFWKFGKSKGQKVRIALLSVFLIGASLWEYTYFLRPLAHSRSTLIDKNGVCHQTNVSTCSAASAVTLLNLYGIDATEQGVIDTALTKRHRGTRPLGLYRGIRSYTGRYSNLSVRLRKTSTMKLVERNQPAIITVGVPEPPHTAIQKQLITKHNWEPGLLHDVVFFGVDPEKPDHVLIGEPEYGLESWPVMTLDALFKGFALYINTDTVDLVT